MKIVTVGVTPILIHNTEHRNFVETDKVIPDGTILNGEYINIIGKRKGKEFKYRLFKDKDGIIIYEKNTKPMELISGTNGETRIVNLPSVKGDIRTHVIASLLTGVVGFMVAKKMGKPTKTALMVGGAGALVGYGVATYITKKRKATLKTV